MGIVVTYRSSTKTSLSNAGHFLVFLLLISLASAALPVAAQQSLFNVPSSEITRKGGVFVQQQINFSGLDQSNTTLDYGLGHNWEAGINLLGIDYSPSLKEFIRNDRIDGDPLAPLLVINVQKGIPLNEHFKLGIGTQNGWNMTPKQTARFAYFSYANLVGTMAHERIKLNSGLYTGNARYLGNGNKIGFMAGTEVVLHERLHLMADWIQGSHPLGVAVVGLVAYPYRKLPVSFGWQIPNNRTSPRALVIELTWIP